VEEKLRIVYIDRHADWNATFILDLAERSPRFTIEAVIHLPDRGLVSLPDRRAWVMPATAAEFERYHLVIIADGSGNPADAIHAEALGGYLAASGGLLLLADERSPLVFPGAAGLLEPLLPVVRHGAVRVKTGEFYVRPSADHTAHPVAALFFENSRRLDLPPLSGRLTGIAVTSGADVPLVLEDGGEELPFCAIQRIGRGVSAVVFAFPLWRWRLAGEEGRSIYQAFLGGLIQYLAEGIDAPSLEVMADRSLYRTGDELGLTVYARQSRLVERLRGEVIRAEEGGEHVVRTFLFEPESRREGYYRAVLDPLPPGEYRIAVFEVRANGTGFSGETEVTVQPVSVEFLDVSRDTEFLRNLADLSGGAVIDAADIASLPERMI
jgi:hypothetical protein